MFSRWIVTHITSVRGNLHCRKTHVPCGDHLKICGLCIYCMRALDRQVEDMMDVIAQGNKAYATQVL
jgi:hypothetical protein